MSVFWPGGVRHVGDVSPVCGSCMERGKARLDTAVEDGESDRQWCHQARVTQFRGGGDIPVCGVIVPHCTGVLADLLSADPVGVVHLVVMAHPRSSADASAAAVMKLLNSSTGLFAEADQSTLTRRHLSDTRRYAFAGLYPCDLLMLVTRYHGVWIMIPASTSHPSSPM